MDNIISVKLETALKIQLTRFKFLLDTSKLDHKVYQLDGVKWCLTKEMSSTKYLKGGLIADEMGLGKTLLMIGTMFSNPLRRTLIILPPVLIGQWFSEIYRITGHKPILFYGDKLRETTTEDLKNAIIVITSYYTICGKHGDKLKQVLWNRVIHDEAHHLRNRNTTRFRSCKLIKSHIKWFITGTPIQNSIDDLYSICNMLNIPVSFYTEPENHAILRKSYILRRTKKQVGIDLPPINVNNVVVSWSNNSEKQLSKEIHSVFSFSKIKYDNKYNFATQFKSNTFRALMLAKQSCIMPSLMKNYILNMVKTGRISTHYLKALDYSSKLDKVVDTILSRKNNGKGKIIFCTFRKEIDFIHSKLTENGFNVATLDGRKSRRAFNQITSQKYDAIILQIQVGCEGLNLQKDYSEVYFVSPHWNPSIEDQAIARCHRIGQLNKVSVFRFAMDTDTVEEVCEVTDTSGNTKLETVKVKGVGIEQHIHNTQDRKREISTQILDIKQ